MNILIMCPGVNRDQKPSGCEKTALIRMSALENIGRLFEELERVEFKIVNIQCGSGVIVGAGEFVCNECAVRN